MFRNNNNNKNRKLNHEEMMNSRERTKRIRLALLLATGAFSGISLLILTTSDPSLDCPRSGLRTELWLTFSVTASSFLLLMLHFVYLGWILKKANRWMGLYYFYVVAAMIGAQAVFFNGSEVSLSLIHLYSKTTIRLCKSLTQHQAM